MYDVKHDPCHGAWGGGRSAQSIGWGTRAGSGQGAGARGSLRGFK